MDAENVVKRGDFWHQLPPPGESIESDPAVSFTAHLLTNNIWFLEARSMYYVD